MVDRSVNQVLRRVPGATSAFTHTIKAPESNRVTLERVLSDAGLSVSGLGNDRRGAPYYCEALDNENAFLSATDEDNISCAVCVRADENCDLVGIGIDIAKVAEFEDEKSLKVMGRRLLAVEECNLLQGMEPCLRPQMLATMFSVREAAVKCIADQVRNYENRGSAIRGMSLADFMMLTGINGQVGVTPRGEAVLDLVGVGSIETAWQWSEGYVVTTAIAY